MDNRSNALQDIFRTIRDPSSSHLCISLSRRHDHSSKSFPSFASSLGSYERSQDYARRTGRPVLEVEECGCIDCSISSYLDRLVSHSSSSKFVSGRKRAVKRSICMTRRCSLRVIQVKSVETTMNALLM